MTDPGPIRCEPVLESDFPRLVTLLAQLGYNLDEAEIAKNVGAIRKHGGEVFVARMRGDVVGCVGAIIDVRLAGGLNGEIVSLVVLESMRGRGIGKRLVDVAEAWLAAFVSRIRLRANARRVDAHRFYTDAGYQEEKTQKVFQKRLPR
jgi:GNAT superfamily N-acetyltransferase